jgi:hypothetical protein
MTGLLLVALALSAEPVDRAFQHIYNVDFAGAIAILDGEMKVHPGNPLLYSARGAALLFSEFNRLGVLDAEFLVDDEKMTDKRRLKPDATVRQRLLATTGEARRLAGNATDRDALFALAMATGIELEYTLMVEKAYFRGFALSKESQKYARRLLALDPPVYDAYLTVGSAEYYVGSLNRFFRLFVRLDNIEGSKSKAMANLQTVVEKGRYYPTFARILLALFTYREVQIERSALMVRDLVREYPNNPLLRRAQEQIEARLKRR